MISTTINDERAVPLRAVPFITGGAFDGRTLVQYIVPEEDQWPHPAPTLYRRDGAGQWQPMHRGELLRMKREMTAEVDRSIAALRTHVPMDVWVLEDDVRKLYSSVQYDYYDRVKKRVDFEIGHWSTTPVMSAAERDYVAAGSGHALSAAKPRKHGMLNADGIDESLKAQYVETARQLARSSGGRKPTKQAVAEEMAKKLNRLKSTLERQVLANWYQS